MPDLKRAKTRKQTRNHSNLRPKHRQTKDFLKVYYPYLPLASIIILILSIVQPWQGLLTSNQGVLPYATQMSVQGLIEETNERRAANQETNLSLNAQLTKAAQKKAQDMAERNYWSHNTPEGNAPWEFVNNAGYSYAKAGENLAYGFDDEDAVVAGWMNSPGHRANMLDVNYSEVGFGFAESDNYVDSGYSTIVVAMYGQPSGAASATESAPLNGDSGAYNTLGLSSEPTDTPINRLQSWINTPSWIDILIAGLVGALGMYLIIKHSRRLKRSIRGSEKFIMRHPLLDVTLVALIILGLVISQQTGIIR